MRQFLMKAIIPVLTEGMIDVWRVGPTDPVDYLADYIFKKSNELAKWFHTLMLNLLHFITYMQHLPHSAILIIIWIFELNIWRKYNKHI